MSWSLTKSVRFEAAHRLPWATNKCSRLHGHSYMATLLVEGDALQTDGPEQGMILDYTGFGSIAKKLIEEELDHRCLNEITGLENPTAEILARWIYERLNPLIGTHLAGVRIAETCTSEAEYRP